MAVAIRADGAPEPQAIIVYTSSPCLYVYTTVDDPAIVPGMEDELDDLLTGYREDVTNVVRGRAPKRPWKCLLCTASMSYRHTYEKHLLSHRIGQRPANRQLGQVNGEIRCGVEGCSAGYRNESEADMHRQARHPRAHCS